MKTALLVLDVKETFLQNLENRREVVRSAATAVSAAREAGIPVIYVKPVFRDGTPEISANNKFFRSIKEKMPNAGGAKDEKFAEEIAPEDGEIIIGKKRISAFFGTELDLVLRAKNIENIVLMGVMARGAVLSTLCDGADRDYRITVLSDACADPDPQIFELLMTKIFPMQADVMTAENWANQLKK